MRGRRGSWIEREGLKEQGEILGVVTMTPGIVAGGWGLCWENYLVGDRVHQDDRGSCPVEAVRGRS